MNFDKFETLKNAFQEVIDCIAKKDAKDAQLKLVVAGDMLNEMLDLTITDDDLVIMRQYQILITKLEESISLLN